MCSKSHTHWGNRGRRQPENADWNVLGYGNNGIREHAIRVKIV
jgi:hypothetical protein